MFDQIEELIESLNQETISLKKQKDEIDKNLARVEKKLFSAKDTLEMLSEKFGNGLLEEPIVEIRPDNPYSGLTVLDALEKIAKENNGVLNTFEARKKLVEADFYPDEKMAASNIYPRLSSAKERFRKSDETGIYYLIDKEPEIVNKRLEENQTLESVLQGV